MKYELTQQALIFLRSCLAVTGWVKTTMDMFNAGRLLTQLPEPDVSWIRSDADLLTLSAAERADYVAFDRDFAAKIVTFELTDKDRDLVRECLKSSISRIPPGKFTYELFKTFGFEG